MEPEPAISPRSLCLADFSVDGRNCEEIGGRKNERRLRKDDWSMMNGLRLKYEDYGFHCNDTI